MSQAENKFLDTARPLAEALMDYIAREGKNYGITDARIGMGAGEKQEISVENGKVSEAISGADRSIQITLYAGTRKLTFSKNTFDGDELRAAILQNMQVIHLVPGNTYGTLLEAGKVDNGSADNLDLYDETQPPQEALVAYVQRMEEAALAVPGAKTTRSTGVEKETTHALVLATNGADKYSEKTLYSAAIEAIAEDASGMQASWAASEARHFADMEDPGAVGQRAAEEAAAMLGATLPKTGTMPIILAPAAAEAFFTIVFNAISGAAVFKDATFMKGQIGKQVMSKGITLVDDPSIVRGLGSQFSDRAGQKSEKIAFIEDGVLNSYSVELESARRLGIEPIGRTGGPTNGIIMPGDQTPEELMSDVEDGIYITGFRGGQVDVNTGQHSREAYGLLIKDGKVTNVAVEGFVVSGNLKDMFMKVSVANDTPAMPSSRTVFATPTTRINGITIAGQ